MALPAQTRYSTDRRPKPKLKASVPRTANGSPICLDRGSRTEMYSRNLIQDIKDEAIFRP
jgi:hypothetical protein